VSVHLTTLGLTGSGGTKANPSAGVNLKNTRVPARKRVSLCFGSERERKGQNVYSSVEENYSVYCGDNISQVGEICKEREGKKKRDKDRIKEMRKANI
jgi:hypothetical protein